MHTFTAKHGTKILYNNDYLGSIKIVVDTKAVEKSADPEKVWLNIPCEDILEFVAHYIRQQRITKIEQAPVDQILGV